VDVLYHMQRPRLPAAFRSSVAFCDPKRCSEEDTMDITIDGCQIFYRVFGERGIPLVLTPGGRESHAAFRPLARAIAADGTIQVVLWDRQNTGASDIWISDEKPEFVCWADTAAALARQLGLVPAYFGGGSAGCRTSLVAAIRHPDVVKGLVLFMPSGGPGRGEELATNYHQPYIEAAERGGMEAVAETRWFKPLIAANPATRDRLLGMDPQYFIQVMRSWIASYSGYNDNTPVGATTEQLRGLTMPVLQCEGNDRPHPKIVSDRMAELVPDIELIPTPWTEQEWDDYTYGRVPGSLAQDVLVRLAQPYHDWILQTDARLTAQAAS
jgi:pimeloyl-ACP methyl ester carboxylesterase